MESTQQKWAVVVIHGIGEQKPMGTLRRFVEALAPDPPAGQPKFRSKPDRLAEMFELRKLMTAATGNQPAIDYYEYYWAYHIEGTRYRHVLRWFGELLWRKPATVARRLRWIWWLSWLLIGAGVFFAGAMIYAEMRDIQAISAYNWVIVVGAFALLYGLHWFTLGYIGDAARYLNPAPENIALRQKIRAEGVRLLRRLHRSREYGRIVVVGHSLGSVIAYDILRYLWIEFSSGNPRPVSFDEQTLGSLENAGIGLTQQSPAGDIDRFREAQYRLWRNQRTIRNLWLVTDLITLGSPLVYAAMLLAQGQDELRARQSELELPVCPPMAQEKRYSSEAPDGQGWMLHHGALFACTRWTNLYFPGDIIAGPLRPVLGPGIKDVVLAAAPWRLLGFIVLPGWLVSRLPMTHTWYWTRVHAEGAVEALQQELDLPARRLPH